MIRIVHLITDLNAGGAEWMLYRLISAMDRSHFHNTVVSLTGRGNLGIGLEQQGVPLHTLGMRPGMPDPGGTWRLIRLLKSQRPQILQTWLYHADLMGLIAGKMAGVPAVIWNLRCSELSRDDHPRSLFFIMALLARASRVPKAVIANSKEGRLAHERLGYRPVRWEVIPNGFDAEVFRPSGEARASFRKAMGLREDTPIVGMVARYNVMKDHGNFLEAARLLRKERPSVRFLLVGQGITKDNKALMTDIASRGLADCVLLLGERADLPSLNATLDVAACSSYSEGFPNVIGEAMSCGVPCAATDVGDTADLIGATGCVVPPREPGALAAAMKRILDMDDDGRRRLGLQARQRIIDHFGIRAAVGRYEQLYQSVLSDPRGLH